MKISRRMASFLLLLSILGYFPASILVAGVTSAPPSQAGELKAEDLLAATLRPADVSQMLPNPGSWWPLFPEFNTGLSDKRPGERFVVVQNYQLVAPDAKGTIENVLILFEDEKSASEAFSALSEADAQKGGRAAGPSLGSESRYFSRTEDGEQAPYAATLRFRVGKIIGRLSTFRQTQDDKPEKLAVYAAPVIKKAGELLNGSLRAAPVPEEITSRLPRGAEGTGPAMGSALVPVESWALIDTTKDATTARDHLRKLGSGDLGCRRFGVVPDPEQVVDAVLFAFPDEKAAAEWVREFLNEKEPGKRLDAGKTGSLSMFTHRQVSPEEGKYGSIYELQFAKGRFVADTVCFSPFAKTSQVCEEVVRKLAESWFAELK